MEMIRTKRKEISEPKKRLVSGNLAISLRPMAFRPCLATGLALCLSACVIVSKESTPSSIRFDLWQ